MESSPHHHHPQHPQPQGPLQPGSSLDGRPGGGQWPFSGIERLRLKTNKRLPGQRAEKWFQQGVWAARRPFSRTRWAVRSMAENQSRDVCVCKRTCVAVTAAGAPGGRPPGDTCPPPGLPDPQREPWEGGVQMQSPRAPAPHSTAGAPESSVSLRVSQILVRVSQNPCATHPPQVRS